MFLVLLAMFFLSRVSSYQNLIRRPSRLLSVIASGSLQGAKEKDLNAFTARESSLTVKTAYEEAQLWLRQREVEDPEESARYLLCHLSEIGSYLYSDFLSNQQKTLSVASILWLNQMLRDRAEAKPIQYILGNWDFYGHTFLCKPPVLIPRPETEELVELILRQAKASAQSKPLRILDIGSGSGVIGISLALNLKDSIIDSIDLNEKAVALTKENAELLLPKHRQDSFQCYHMDYQTFLQKKSDLLGKFDIIVSNPPYIPSREMATLQKEVRLYEDHRALDGGEDGLSIARDIMNTCPSLLKPNGLRTLWFELSREHPLLLENQYKDSSVMSVKAFNDFTKNPRFVKIVYN